MKLLILATALTGTALNTAAEPLPDGPGKELVEAICTTCHDTDRIVTQHLSKPQWEAKVLEMLQEEPDVTQPERDKIVEYLAKAFPAKTNVNKAQARIGKGLSK